MRDRRHLTHASNYQRAAASHKLRPSYVLSRVFLSNYARRFVLLVSPVCHSSVSCRLERFIIISWPSYWSVLSWLCKPPPGTAVHRFQDFFLCAANGQCCSCARQLRLKCFIWYQETCLTKARLYHVIQMQFERDPYSSSTYQPVHALKSPFNTLQTPFLMK